jgi:hypothetical protein
MSRGTTRRTRAGDGAGRKPSERNSIPSEKRPSVNVLAVTAPGAAKKMVGATGFEPVTTRTPSVCATRLRYAPTRREVRGM